jgi:hypothetical protein
MKDGISFIPKHCLLILLNDLMELVQDTSSIIHSDSLYNRDKNRKLKELFSSKSTSLLLTTSNKAIDLINSSEDEISNIIAEMELHIDTYHDVYQEMFSEMADTELDEILDKLGMYKGLSGDSDD